jgi:hypothetical protein
VRTFQKHVEHEQHFAWYPKLGIGYLPFRTCGLNIYDKEYWEKYCRYDDTPLGAQLTKARIDFMAEAFPYITDVDMVVDVGVGAGRFLMERSREAPTLGYDINPYAIEWLKSVDKFHDLRTADDRSVNVLTMWDVLEHIEDPEMYLEKVSDYVFISTPIFKDLDHLLSSVHYRPDEHCWYFTRDGCLRFMEWHGFEFHSQSMFETDLGRKDIASFAFERKHR